MSSLRRILSIIISAILVSYLFLVGFVFIFVTSSRVESSIREYAKKSLGAVVDFKNFRVEHWPLLRARADEFVLEIPSQQSRLEARDLNLRISIMAALFHQPLLSSIRFKGGDWVLDSGPQSSFAPIHLSDVDWNTNNLGGMGPAHVEIRASYVDVPRALHLTGVVYPEFSSRKKNWTGISFEGDIELERFILSQISHVIRPEVPFSIRDGQASGKIHFSKKSGSARLDLKSQFQADQVIYEMKHGESSSVSPPFQIQSQADFGYDFSSQEWILQGISLVTPLGHFDLRGKILSSTGEIKELRISAPDILVANIPQYILPLSQLIPARVGFSGTSGLETSMEGTWNHLSIDANWDLGATLLTYGNFFTKPKELPLTALFHLLLDDGQKISGDFSVRLKDMSCKGTISKFNLKDQTAQVNIISNKFGLQGWESLLPPLNGFTLDGEMKLLLNYVEDLDPRTAGQNILNISFSNGAIKRDGWPAIQKVSGILDTSPLAVELRNGSFEIGDSTFESNLVVYNLEDNLNYRGGLKSRQLHPRSVAEVISKMETQWSLEEKKPFFVLLRQILEKSFPSDAPVDLFSSTFHYEKKHFFLDEFKMDAFSGQADGSGDLDLNPHPWKANLSANITGWNLANYLPKTETQIPFMVGKLFLDGKFSSTGVDWDSIEKQMTASGNVSVTQGSFNTIDVLASIGEIDGFGEVGLLANKKTDFKDWRSKFRIADRKISFNEMTLYSQDLSIDGSGETGFDGLLNFRLNTYLSTALTTHFLTPILGGTEDFQGKQFGPLPLLLSGPSTQPKIQGDSRQLDHLKEDLFRKRTQQILRNFVPEEKVFSSADKK